MFRLFRRRTENAWTETDRQERTKMILATLAIVAAVGGGIALLIYALTAHH